MFQALKGRVRRALFPPLHRPDVKRRYRFLGTRYGGWPVPENSLGAGSVVYSFGIGEDISFDLGVIASFGSAVHAFDPTPKCITWMSGQSTPPELHFHPVGLAAHDGEVEFYAPANPAHVSFSNAPGEGQTGAPIKAPVMTVRSIMNWLDHKHVDVIKMDIEGFEYDVIENLLSTAMRPSTLLIEFHHDMYAATKDDTRNAVDRLRRDGYKIFYVSDVGREYGFCRTEDGRP